MSSRTQLPGDADADASDFVGEALPAFISEAREQADTLEQLLLQLEHQPGDTELLNALFRCAHTVKGSAGIFGLEAVVAFTHHVETLLDQVRNARVQLNPDHSTLLLQCNDELRRLIDAAAAGGAARDEAGAAAHRDDLVAALQAACLPSAALAAGAAAAAGSAPDGRASEAAVPRRWHVSAVFGSDTFRNGMDPLAILNYVRKLGDVPHLVCDLAAVPALDDLDVEACHLGFEFGLVTAASRSAIEAAFSFVRDDCRLHIVEPEAGAAGITALIEAMPDRVRLGDILVAAGAITAGQLRQALLLQQQAGTLNRPAPLLGEVLQATTGVCATVVAAALDKQDRQRGVSPAGSPTGAAAATPADEQRYIRVQASRLDSVINLLGELVIAGAGAALLSRQTRHKGLVEAHSQIGRLIEEVRNGTLQLRMVPIGETFARFRRVVRDTAAELGKEVALEMAGSETELDKSVVERIADPLMHLVRNALDHGLEPAAERSAAGKPTQGRLLLSACHESGSILIRISDDGRGIKRQRVLERAWERGLVEAGVTPDDDAILRLIFEPGFSTAEQITNLSGRGVGMDVVKRNIEALRGTVTLSSSEGRGTQVEIRLPLTLAIIDGFLIGVGASRFILPLDAVVEVIENRAAVSRIDSSGRGSVELRGQVLPVVSLRILYALQSAAPERSSVVVLRAGNRRFGVVVDQLLGQHQTVIKPLGRMFRSLRGMSGSSILGNGDVALIFDVHALGHLAANPTRPAVRDAVTTVSAEGRNP